MANIIQKEDLHGGSFSNDNSLANEGVRLRTNAGSVFNTGLVAGLTPMEGIGPPSGPPVFNRRWYVDNDPNGGGRLWYWDGSEWKPTGTLVLNFPTVYVRPDGDDDAVVHSQSDLTVANAFRTLSGYRAWMAKGDVIIRGILTLDIRGPAENLTIGNVTRGLYGADQINFVGNPGGVQGAIIPWGSGSQPSGINAIGTRVGVSHVTFEAASPGGSPGPRSCVSAVHGGSVRISGNIRLNGFYNANAPDYQPVSPLFAARVNGNITMVPALLRFAMDAGTAVQAVLLADTGGAIGTAIGALQVDNAIALTGGHFGAVRSGGTYVANLSGTASATGAGFTGAVSSIRLDDGASSSFSEGNRAQMIAQEFGTGLPMQLAPGSTMSGDNQSWMGP